MTEMKQNKEINIQILDKKTVSNGIYPPIEMDYENFRLDFQVFSDDKIKAYQLLTSNVMEILKKYKNEYQIEFDITFYDNIIYYRFNTGTMFEASMNENVMQKEKFYKYYMALHLVKELSEEVYKFFSELED